MNSPKGPLGPESMVNDMTDLIVPSALRTWIIFLLVFSLLGYSVGFSILFGALGGFAGGMISAWWMVPGGAPMSPELEDQLRSQQNETGQRLRSLVTGRFPKLSMGREKRHLQRRRRQG